MAPLVVAPHPDLTDSEEEKNESTATDQSVKKNNEDIIISTSAAHPSKPGTAQSVKKSNEDINSTSPAEASEPILKSLTAVDCNEAQQTSDETSVAQSSAVDALQVKHIHDHPWEGEPAKEPEYPPGTYRGMF